MALFERIRHLIKADAHGVVDALEDEALVLRQCVRDAAAALDRKRARRAALAAESKRLAAELDGLGARIEGLDADVELALAEGQEELARFSLRRLLPIRRARTAAAARIEVIEREAAELDAALEDEAAALDALRSRVRERLSRLESSPEAAAPDGAVHDAEIELELLRRRRGMAPNDSRMTPDGSEMASDGIEEGV